MRPDRETFVRLASEMNDRQISRLYGCTSPTVAKWRDFYGVPRSPRQSGGNTTKWSTDRGYFGKIDRPEKAYILGFLLADGHINKEGYKVQVSVKETDADLLQAIADEMGSEAPLATTVNHYDQSRMMRLVLYGRQLVDDLAVLGLRHDKSVTATFPAIDPDMESHLVRGLWDGDGYIGERVFELIGTSAVLDGAVAAAQRHTGCVLRRRMSGKDRRYHYAFGTRRDTPVLHWMYSGATIALGRKRERFISYWPEIPRACSLNHPVGLRQAGSAADYPSAATLF